MGGPLPPAAVWCGLVVIVCSAGVGPARRTGLWRVGWLACVCVCVVSLWLPALQVRGWCARNRTPSLLGNRESRMLCDRNTPGWAASSTTHSAAPTTQQTPKPILFLRHSSLNTLSPSANTTEATPAVQAAILRLPRSRTFSTAQHTSTQLPTMQMHPVSQQPTPAGTGCSEDAISTHDLTKQHPRSMWWYCDGSSCSVAAGWSNH